MRSTRTLPIALSMIAVVVALIAVGSVLFLRGYTGQVDRTEDAEQVAGVGLGVVQEVQLACAVEDTDPERRAIRDAGLCDTADEAEKVIEDSPATVTAADGRDGRDGVDGVDGVGRGPSDSQLVAAVVAYCAERNQCTPPPPRDGVDGQNGTDGADGADGSNGADGAPAPVITSSECNADDEIVLNFDDGTSIPVAGSDCRVALIDPLTPEP